MHNIAECQTRPDIESYTGLYMPDLRKRHVSHEMRATDEWTHE